MWNFLFNSHLHQINPHISNSLEILIFMFAAKCNSGVGGGVVYDLNFSLTAVLKLSNNNRCQITVSASLSNKTNILDGEKAG